MIVHVAVVRPHRKASGRGTQGFRFSLGHFRAGLDWPVQDSYSPANSIRQILVLENL